MSIEQARTYLSQAQDIIAKALGELTNSPASIVVRAGQSIQAAIDLAKDNQVISIEPGTYDERLKIARPVVLEPTVPINVGRVGQTSVTIISAGETVTLLGDGIGLRGLTLRSSNPDMQIVNHMGHSTLLDRCAILGDPVKGQHRGVAANGSDLTMFQCRVDDIFAVGRDTQAVLGWDGTKNLVINDCHLSAAAEAVMLGGAPSATPDRIPTGIKIVNSTLTKNREWFSRGLQIKNAFEVKSAVNVALSNCLLEYAGISAGQGGYAIVLTTRNPGGTAPWSRIEDVVIDRCHVRYAGGCVNFLGSDDSQISGTTKNVRISNVAFTDIDPLGITKGAGRCFLFQRAPENVVLEKITVKGTNLAAQMYVVPPAPTGLVLRNVVMPTSKYGMKIDGGGAGPVALQALMPDAVLQLGTSGANPEIEQIGL